MKISNQDLRELEAIAKKLPPMENRVTSKRRIKGGDVIKHNLVVTIEGQPVNPAKVYELSTPIVTPVNHLRRLKGIYQQHGEAGVRAYIDKVKALEAKTETPLN